MKQIKPILITLILLSISTFFNLNILATEISSDNIIETTIEESSIETSSSETITDESTSNEETSSINNEETTTISEEDLITRILFLGNSATYYNDMPFMVEKMAQADGINTEVTMLAVSGYKLHQFIAEDGIYLEQIKTMLNETKYDYVIVQDHRETMLTNPTKSENSIIFLKDLIESSGSEMILYETQADYTGNTFKINGSLVYLDHYMMQYYLTKNYFNIGNRNNLKVSACGPNYTRCGELFPEINLYNQDNLHPSVAGSYLAACTLYETIFNKSAYENSFIPGSELDENNLLKDLSLEDALKIKKICDVRLKLDNYNLNITKTTNGQLNVKYEISEGNDYLTNNSSDAIYTNKIEFFSLNDDIVSINRKKGIYTAIKPGEATLMAITDDGQMVMCNVTVTQPCTSLEVTTTDIVTLFKGDTYTYKVKILPKDTTDSYTFISSNPSVVKVDELGTITALQAGVSDITITTDNGLTATRRVRVRLATPSKVSVKKMKTKAKSKKYANIKIKWKKNKNAISYNIFRKSSKTKTYKKIGSTTNNYFIDKNRRKNRKYYYQIRAIHNNGYLNSKKSSSKSIDLK